MNKLPCEVVRDLLPLYADDLVSETTGEMIKEHISGCDDCRKRYEGMKDYKKRNIIEDYFFKFLKRASGDVMHPDILDLVIDESSFID